MKKIYLLILNVFLCSCIINAQIVVNEVYGGGGNSGATYKNDFIELFNTSSSPVSLSGWSVQYASAAGTTWSVTNLSGTIPANGYYLIQEAVGTGGTTNLPTPDATGTIAMSATAGKVILVNSTTAQSGSNPIGPQIIDKVGFGTTATGFEGVGPAPAPSNTTSVQRTPIGTDTGNNNADFSTGSPSPTTSGGVADVTPPVINSLFPSNGATGVITSFTAAITFNESIQKGTSGTITIKKSSDNSVIQTTDVTTSVTVSGSGATFDVIALELNTAYFIEISNGAFKDLSSNNFSGISGNSTWTFTTASAPPSGAINTIYTFNTCGFTLPDGFTQFSTTGNISWACSAFGRDPAAPTGTAQAPNGIQINGFANGTNVKNVDWFISPSFDLTSTNYPLLSFWSRTAFNGLPLQLKISTNYTAGNPAGATWIDFNGKFPAQATNVWTLSNNINLAAFKQPNVHFAFVYTSSDDDGARWTLDDISINNSATPPPASITTSTTDMQFTFVASGNTSTKSFILTGNDITTDITVASTGSFQLSKDGTNFSSSLFYTVAEANNTPSTITVRFAPAQPGQNFSGVVTINTSGLTSSVNLKGNSIDPLTTLEVVNWNIEWFGSTVNGPTNDVQQELNVKTILQNIGADLYGLVEVVNESRLQNIVSQMPGYAYVLGQYGSHVNPPDVTGGPLAEAQKLGFVYKTSVFSNITTRPLINNLNTSSTSYYNWASGRYPFLMNADVTLNGLTRNINFILIHAKANTSPTATSYARRQASANELHDTLITYFPVANIVVLGDFNDDLDQSITAGFTTTSYSSFTNDNTNFFSPTLALSLAGKKSTVSYNDVIDHVIVSNEMQPYFMNSSASILSDVSTLVTNYGSTTSDHFPVFTQFSFAQAAAPLPVKLIMFEAAKDDSKVKLTWITSSELNAKEFVIERAADGRNFQSIGKVNASGNSNNANNYLFNDAQPYSSNNYYRLRMIDQDAQSAFSKVLKIDFSKLYTISIFPNPAKTDLTVSITNNRKTLEMEIIDMHGKTVLTQIISSLHNKIQIGKLSKGIYMVRVKGFAETYAEKLFIE